MTTLCDPSDYAEFIAARKVGPVPAELRNRFALKAFTHTASYDTAISNHFRRAYASADSISSAPADEKAELRERAQQITLRCVGFVGLCHRLRSCRCDSAARSA